MFGTGFGMGSMWLWGLLALIGLLLLIFVIVRVTAGGVRNPGPAKYLHDAPGKVAKSTPREILDERYAKGELTTEEYRERHSALGELSVDDAPTNKDG